MKKIMKKKGIKKKCSRCGRTHIGQGHKYCKQCSKKGYKEYNSKMAKEIYTSDHKGFRIFVSSKTRNLFIKPPKNGDNIYGIEGQ